MAPTALEFGYSCLVPVIYHNCINPAANLIWLFRWAFFSYKGCSQTVDPPQLTRNSLRTLLPNPTVLTANTLKTFFSGDCQWHLLEPCLARYWRSPHHLMVGLQLTDMEHRMLLHVSWQLQLVGHPTYLHHNLIWPVILANEGSGQSFRSS